MKNSFVYAAFVCVSAGLSSCHDDTKELLQTIDGQWEVKSIQFTNKAGRDSTVTTSQTYLNFESCSKASNGQSPGNCAVQYRIGSKNYNFTYQANGKESIYFTPTESQDPTYRQIASVVEGSYEVLSMTSTSLVLRKKTNCTTQGGTEACEYIRLTAAK